MPAMSEVRDTTVVPRILVARFDSPRRSIWTRLAKHTSPTAIMHPPGAGALFAVWDSVHPRLADEIVALVAPQRVRFLTRLGPVGEVDPMVQAFIGVLAEYQALEAGEGWG